MSVILELLFRFIVGGLVVSAFAVIGDILRPKSFAGIFGAAPSVAIATAGLTFALKGPHYISIEGRSMMAGAAGFLLYSLLCGRLLLGPKVHPLVSAGAAFLAWFVAAFALWAAFLR